jgi:hypothetical protein
MSRSKLFLAALAASLALITPARADVLHSTDRLYGNDHEDSFIHRCGQSDDVFNITDSISGSSVVTKTYAFTITDPAIYMATLTDVDFPAPFQLLELGVVKTGSGPLLGSIDHAGSFSFTALAAGSYTLLLIGQPNSTAQAGFFSINVSQFAPIPEPAIWFLMASGIGLIGFLKLRSRDRVVAV